MSTLAQQLVLILVALALLIGQVVVARRLGPTTVMLVSAQAIFWLLAFVLRPLYLVIREPTLNFELADRRLAMGSYGSAVVEVLWLVVIGLLAFLATLYLLSRMTKPTEISPQTDLTRRTLIMTGLFLWAVGWAGRFAALTGAGSILAQLRPMGIVGAVLVIVSLKSKRRHAPSVGAVVALEIIWALTWESKAAMVLPVLALCLRWIIKGRVRTLLRALPVLAVGVLVGFFTVQSLRGIFTDEKAAALGSQTGSPLASYYVGLLQRFDGFSSVTDAFYFGPGRWMSNETYLSRLAENVVPKFGAGQDRSVGVIWTRDIRAATIPNQFLDVPIAAGPTAEGYAMWGIPGVIGLNVVLALLVFLLGRGLASSRVLVFTFAVSMSFTTGIFEVASQGWAGMVNKSLQATFVALIVSILARTIARRTGPSQRRRGATIESNVNRRKVQLENV